MIIEQRGFKPLTGRVTEALKFTLETLEAGKKVVYITTELSKGEVVRKIQELEYAKKLKDMSLLADLHVTTDDLNIVSCAENEDVVIVVDSFKKLIPLYYAQAVYVFYQSREV